MAGGYKNGVGGRGAEPIGQYVSVSKVGSSLNRSLAISSEHLVDTFRRTIGRFVEWICIPGTFEVVFPFKNHALISFIINQSRRRGSSVASTLDAVRETTVSGDRQSTIPLRTCAAFSSSFLSFIELTAVGSLVGGAETKPPREKSFISAISQIENEAKKSGIRVTSEVRKCPKTRFCRFSFSRNLHFCDLQKNWGGVGKNDPFHKICLH